MPDMLNQIAGSCPPLLLPAGPALFRALKLTALHLPLVFFALNFSKTLLKKHDLLERLLASAVIYFLAIGLGAWILPCLSYAWLLAWSVFLGIAGIIIKILSPTEAADKVSSAPSLPAISGTILVCLFALSLLVKGIIYLNYDADPLIYQLHFAAAWLQQGRITIVPTPFGDPSQAYGPALASIYYVWLMAPLRTDMLAATGAWAFLVLSILSATALARELGVRHGYSWSAALFALTAPFFVHEGSSALSDLLVAGCFSSSLYYFIRAVRKESAIDLGLALVSSGLMIGGKYTGATLLLILIPPALPAFFKVRGRGAWLAWPAGIILGCAGGGIWYLRNLVVTGNPFFPIRISFMGLELFPGLYGRDLMLGWVFHKEGAKAWLQVVLANASLLFIAAGMIAIAVMLVMGLKISAGKESESPRAGSGDDSIFEAISAGVNPRLLRVLVIYVALSPVMIDRLNWHLVPFQEERFWISIISPMSAILAAVFSRKPSLLFAALAAAYGGLFMATPELSYLDMKARAWIEAALPACAVSGIGLGWLTHRHLPDRSLFRRIKGASFPPYLYSTICTLLLTVFIAWGLRGHEQRREKAYMIYPFGEAWKELPCPDEGITLAYAGSNVPYPLFGPRLDNQVVYVSPSGLVSPRDHEVLREFPGEPPRFMTPEPEISRIYLCPRKWAESVLSSGADFLFVTRLGRNELLNVAHSESGWPLEDQWARSAPLLFRLVLEEGFSRIYQVERLNRDVIASLAQGCERRPADAISANWESPDKLRRYFPRALRAIEDMKILDGKH